MAVKGCVHQDFTLTFLVFYCFLTLGASAVSGEVILPTYNHEEVYELLDEACFIAGISPVSDELRGVLSQLTRVYREDGASLRLGLLSPHHDWLSTPTYRLKVRHGSTIHPLHDPTHGIVIFPKRVKDRTCLVQSNHLLRSAVGDLIPAPWTVETLVEKINTKCNTLRDVKGGLTIAGLHRRHILQHLFHVDSISNVTMRHLVAAQHNMTSSHDMTSPPDNMISPPDSAVCDKTSRLLSAGSLESPSQSVCVGEETCHRRPTLHTMKTKQSTFNPYIPSCDILTTPPSRDQFFHEYLKRSRPFILRNATTSWPAFTKWTNDFLRSEYGDNDVHVKLTPNGDFEGVEEARLWENYNTFIIPPDVIRQLTFPDLVTVRPAGVNMNFSQLLDLIERTAREGREEGREGREERREGRENRREGKGEKRMGQEERREGQEERKEGQEEGREGREERERREGREGRKKRREGNENREGREDRRDGWEERREGRVKRERQKKREGKRRRVSAYLEYSSIPDYMAGLEDDVTEPAFMTGLLRHAHLNVWLSDGDTLGRLHFDQFDNLLCQISGSKELTLFEPHDNRRLYEAHIPQATLTYNAQTETFRRATLDDSTSMVMSPVNLQQPDLERFPLFGGARPLHCTIYEGDLLYLPSFWWHEVQSSPSHTQHRNLAVNFWYEPFLLREFPCPECQLDVNPKYHHLLTGSQL